MGITADELLAGPRGRRACLAVAVSLEAAHAPPVEDDPWRALPLDAAQHRTEQAHTTSPGASYFIAFEEGTRVTRRARRLARRAVDADQARLRERAGSTVAPLASALAAVAAATVGRAPFVPVPEAVLNAAVAQAVDSARMWQEPEGIDAPLALPELRRALRPFAEAIARSPASGWWNREADPGGQWLALRDDHPPAALASPGPATEPWEEWRRGRLRAEALGDDSHWWSAPGTHDLPRTHGTFGSGLPTVALWEEDGMGWCDGISAVRVDVPSAPRVFEVRGAGDWALLCTRYPLVLTRSLGRSLRRGVGPDPVRGAGGWVIPDWSAVARDYDAVHLSVAAYLSASGALIEVPGLGASAIAGWDPDETYWLGRLPGQGAPGPGDERPRRWVPAETGGFEEAPA